MVVDLAEIRRNFQPRMTATREVGRHGSKPSRWRRSTPLLRNPIRTTMVLSGEACAALVRTRANRNLDGWPGKLREMPIPLPCQIRLGRVAQATIEAPISGITTYWPLFLWRSACPACVLRVRHPPPRTMHLRRVQSIGLFSAWAEGMPRADAMVLASDQGMGADLGQRDCQCTPGRKW
jgi:hypothetical protein